MLTRPVVTGRKATLTNYPIHSAERSLVYTIARVFRPDMEFRTCLLIHKLIARS